MDSQTIGYIALALFGAPIAVGSSVMIFLIGFQPHGDEKDWASPASYNPMKTHVERQARMQQSMSAAPLHAAA